MKEKQLDNLVKDNYNKFKSESGHWYTQEGEPMYTIIGIIAKPSLETWKQKQLLNSFLTLEQGEDETIESFYYRCQTDSKQVGIQAAQQGTKIHGMIEKGFLGKTKTKPYKAIKKYLDETFPNEEWIAEDSFCADAGYGGKIDLYSKSGIFIDFKTKDNLQGKDPAKLVFDEHGMQLSAYAQGCGFDDVERVSIFVDRKDTGLVLPFVWDKESHTKHLGMFNAMLTYWKLVKNYDSSVL